MELVVVTLSLNYYKNPDYLLQTFMLLTSVDEQMNTKLHLL